MRILILGGRGMLGHQLFMDLSKVYETWATVRNSVPDYPDLPGIDRAQLIGGVNVLHFESMLDALTTVRPNVVINCIGLIKQHEQAKQSLLAIELNSRLPHQIALLCEMLGSRLIHISTDCVFSGQKGMYIETEPTDAQDIYGKSKALGEVTDSPHVLTIRTSLIGRELSTNYSLVDWFLSQQGSVKGYQKAVFSGFPTYEIADIVRDYIVPHPELHGLYHLSADPINKYDLLCLLKAAYQKDIEIVADSQVVIDRSLNSERFRKATGFTPNAWHKMVEQMVTRSKPYPDWKN